MGMLRFRANFPSRPPGSRRRRRGKVAHHRVDESAPEHVGIGRMQIGKPGEPVTRISRALPDRVEVRGRDLTGELMGRLTFTEYVHLLLTGREPTEEQRFFLDLLLVAIAEHGMMPTNVAARMTLDADPDALQGAVAAGILGCGPVILGTAEECARLLERGEQRVADGESFEQVAHDLAQAIK